MLSGVARAALAAGNEFRSTRVSMNDIIDMCDAYVNVHEPALVATGEESRLRSLLSRVAYEQFGDQYSVMENLGRTILLFEDHASAAEDAPSAREWTALLGASLDQYIRIALAMNIAALQNNGEISRTVLRADHVAPIFHPVGADVALDIVSTRFSAPLEELARQARASQVPGREKWSLNPLIAKPIVALPGDRLVMPWPRLILDMATPTGLYYLGLENFGEAFARSLGVMFESYIGAQLGLLEHAVILPELRYGRDSARTVDYFIVTPEVVVLVEVKSARPVWSTRLGEGANDIVAKIGRAFSQIDKTAAILKGRPDLLLEIPRDRPFCGLVTTLEPFYLLNTDLYDDVLTHPTVPTAVASAHELENAVAALSHRDDIGTRLLNALAPSDGTFPNLTAAAKGLPTQKNTLLDDAWTRFWRPMTEVFERFGLNPDNLRR
jgi:hypothetical protein